MSLSTHQADKDYTEVLQTLAEGSVHRRFDPYLDIAWDCPELAIDPHDPRWALSPDIDPLGATTWYQAQPLDRRIEIGRWRQANAIKVGAAFESILIRGMMQYAISFAWRVPRRSRRGGIHAPPFHGFVVVAF